MKVLLNNKERNLLMDALEAIRSEAIDQRDEEAIEKVYEKLRGGELMNEAGTRAIRQALGNAEDNLARANMQKQADPNWTSGNDETIDDVIAGYERECEALREALAGVES